MLRILLSGMLLALAPAIRSQVFTFDFSGVNAAVPDGQPTGLVNVQSISSAPNLFVADINVTLTIAGTGVGGFTGDLYATLQHESGFAVLLNRPGRRTGSSAGYGDSGMNVTFDDSAIRDIHNYRLELSGSHSTAPSQTLNGAWSPDARNVDPAIVLDGSARNAFLGSFNNLPVNGTWILFVTDLSSGGTQQLSSWGMQITATPVPEPATYAAVTALTLLAFGGWRKLNARRASPR